MSQRGYLGTYTKKQSRGIYSFEYEDGEICSLKLWAQVQNPKYLCFAGEYLASICEFEKGAGVVLFDLKGNKVDEMAFEEVSSCYLAFYEGKLYTANYHEGCIHVIAVQDGKLSVVKRVDIKPDAGTHQIISWEDKWIVPCLLLDVVFIFDKNFEVSAQISFEKGSGPRHALFIPQSPYLYVVGEISNCLYVVDLESLKVIDKQNLIAADHASEVGQEKEIEENAASAIRYYENHLYVSVRGRDVISILEIDEQNMPKWIRTISSFGRHPRDFMIVDHYLLIANRDSNHLVLFDLKREEKKREAQNEAKWTEKKEKIVLEGAFEAISVILSE